MHDSDEKSGDESPRGFRLKSARHPFRSVTDRGKLTTAAAIILLALLSVADARGSGEDVHAMDISGGFPQGEVFTMSVDSLQGEKMKFITRDSPNGDNLIVEGIAIVDAPASVVTAVLSDYEDYKEWMPTITYSVIREEKDGITTLDLKHSVPLFGDFDCRQRLRIVKNGDETIIDYYIVRCVINESNGRYSIKPARDPNKAIVRYYQEVEPSRWMPRFLLEIIAGSEADDGMQAIEQRAKEVGA